MATREQNEHDYPYWEDLPGGGRRYWKNVPGQVIGFARYIKIVNSDEVTTSFVQEVYDQDGNLIGRHQKSPVDTGHEAVEQDGEE